MLLHGCNAAPVLGPGSDVRFVHSCFLAGIYVADAGFCHKVSFSFLCRKVISSLCMSFSVVPYLYACLLRFAGVLVSAFKHPKAGNSAAALIII